MRAAVAQLVEHLVVTQVVPGSSPGGGASLGSLSDERSEGELCEPLLRTGNTVTRERSESAVNRVSAMQKGSNTQVTAHAVSEANE